MKIETSGMSVFDIRISPDQTKFAAGAIDAPIKIYDLKTGEELLSIPDENYDSAWSVDWYVVDGKTFLLAGYGNGGYLRIFDSKGKNVLKYASRSDDYGYPDAAQIHTNSIWKIQVMDDCVYSVSDDKQALQLKLEQKKSGGFTYKRSQEERAYEQTPLYSLCDWDSQFFVVSTENQIRVIEKDKMYLDSRILEGHTNRIVSLAKVSDSVLASSSWDDTLKLWDFEKGTILKESNLTKTGSQLFVYGNKIYYTNGHSIGILDSQTLDKIGEIQTDLSEVRCFDLTKDGKVMVCGGEDGAVEIIIL